MNTALKCFFLIFTIAFYQPLVKAQSDKKTPDFSRFNAKVSVAIPTIIANRSFKNIFKGIYELELNLQCRLVKGFYLGIHGNYAGFKLDDQISNIANSECRISSSGFNVGFEKFSSPRILWYFNLGGGQNWFNYYKLPCADSVTAIISEKGLNVKPSLGFTYYSDDNFSIGMIASYTYLAHTFNPGNQCLQSFAKFKEADSKKSTQYFSIGILLNFNLRKALFQDNFESDGVEDN